MDHTELIDRFRRIVEGPMNDDEVVHLLCETNWVRILVVRNNDAPEEASIEVEMALPECVIEPPIHPSLEKKAEASGARSFVERTIAHLRYLLTLENAGLCLGVVSKEGIWSASTTVKGNPLASFFKTLMPPSVS